MSDVKPKSKDFRGAMDPVAYAKQLAISRHDTEVNVSSFIPIVQKQSPAEPNHQPSLKSSHNQANKDD
ncbi:hypothetical protein BLNAU_18390 [Blattamonas nauphoetae]|uniref:Uncharacterized protein n=1 Tax=Blattamonas nauphoetae TaxID=2049346 RepID=A0ABQ9X4M7_9EUKA|nr:hypothetical protein BLNAU_18390 [Blattamonas nauphoetae]